MEESNDKKETPLPRHLDNIAGGQNGEGQINAQNRSPSVQILNSEPIRRFNLPDSDSERSPCIDRSQFGLVNNASGN